MPDIIPPSAPLAHPPRRTPPAVGLPHSRGRAGAGAIASLLFHGLLVALVFWRGAALLAGGGKGPGPRGGGGGGGAMRFFVLAASAAPRATDISSAAATVHVTSVPLPDPTKLALPKLDAPQTPVTPMAPAGTTDGTGGNTGSGPGSGGGQGSGTGPGVGTDSGPGRGGGDGYIGLADLHGMVISLPNCAPRGRYTLRFWVAADGRITKLTIDPKLKDEACQRDFETRMLDNRFLPAHTRTGQPMASIYPLQITR